MLKKNINLVFISDHWVAAGETKCNATFSFIKGKDYRYHYVYISNDQIHSRCRILDTAPPLDAVCCGGD